MFGNGVENPSWLGGVLGIVFGFIIGLFYSLKLINFIHIYKRGGFFLGKVVLYGILAGLVCSSLVHITLMLFYRNAHLAPIGIGALFGIFSGAVLGAVAGSIFTACYKRKLDTN